MIYTNKMSEAELHAAIITLQDAELPEDQEAQLLELVENSVSDPCITDYIYHDNLTPDEIISAVKQHQPIAL